MKTAKLLVSLFAIAVLLAPVAASCSTPALAADGYTAVVPSVLPAGSEQNISVALFAGSQPTSGRVEVALYQGNNRIASANGNIDRKGSIQLKVPDVPEGDYTIRLNGGTFNDEAKVRIEKNFMIFVETDKPIYKPGQTIQMRAVTLNGELRPLSEKVTIEILDAKGIKIYRKEVTTDDYGMATLDLPLSTEPNLGVWKIIATAPKAKTQVDVRVEEYVLPKYEIKVELPKDWFLVNETIKGKVTAEYSFGKPVKGELKIKATRYVGQWQEYSNFTTNIDGSAEFTVPAAGYVAGVPAAGGKGNVTLDFTVVEPSTGYTEKMNRLLTVAQSATGIKLVPSGTIFKPALPFSFLIVTQTPDNRLIDTRVTVRMAYFDKDLKEIKREDKTVNTAKGKALVEITPPAEAAALTINASAEGAQASKTIEAGYSPSGNFIHVEQTSEGIPQLGDEIQFKVYSTREAANFYYEVVARGKVVFSDFTKNNTITFPATPLMAPSAKLLVYQILPNAEIAADYLPFQVAADYPHKVDVSFSQPEAKPGDEVRLNIQTDGESRVGIAVVDKSVFILAENRLNLQQVFDELEKLYMKPQAELHEVNIYEGIVTRGAKEVFRDAGVVVLSNNKVPEGKEYKNERMRGGGFLPPILFGGAEKGIPVPAAVPAATQAPSAARDSSGLAEVQRVRQFFPETWLWDIVTTGSNGKVSVPVTVPDSITAWMLRAVALSKKAGLGVAETQLRAFQPFFLSIDLPYSAIRSEEFPVKVAVYNYLDQSQNVLVQIQPEDWFELLDNSEKMIDIKGNDIGGVEFKIRPKKLGNNGVKITARSQQAADSVVKTLIIEPEGVAREIVDNLVLSAGSVKQATTAIPPNAIEGSGRVYLTITASYLTQTIEGLEKLLQMPFGCGEQNMIVLAPDVYITKYLKASGQIKPELMAKAEKLMVTGYQRELTYRHNDGSFSAFGNSDKEGSLWLTSFVLKTFAQAKDSIFVDDAVLDKAKTWITSHQNSDGSFDQVGFVTHQEMLGGLKGKTALTAYVAIALMQAGDKTSAARAMSYLEGKIAETDDAYGLALLTYALELCRSPKAGEAYNKLMKFAKEDENGLHWGGNGIEPTPLPKPGPGIRPMPMPPINKTADIETTAYAMLALIKHGDAMNAGRAGKWLVSKRNAYGGYGSTQDTVVTLEALTEFSTGARADVDLTISVNTGSQSKEVRVRQDNFDVLQIIELPINQEVNLNVKGKGEAMAQVVRRFNLPAAEKPAEEILKIDVNYDTTEVAVNDLVKVSVEVAFNPPIPMEAGMTVVDISVPTGFAAVAESIAKIAQNNKNIKRYDISGRKVIFYIENMLPGDKVNLSFDVKALYPVKARGVVSQAYSYYKPEISGETLGRDMVVVAK